MMKANSLFQHCNQFCKLARKEDALSVLKANIGKYIHFSNSERFGIHYSKGVHPGNPRAVYGFPLTPLKYQALTKDNFEAFYEFGFAKYIYVFDVSGKILDMDNPDLNTLAKQIAALARSKYGPNYHLSYTPQPQSYNKAAGPTLLEWLNDIIEDYRRAGIFKDVHSAINILLRHAGYDAMETRHYGFGDDIGSEIAVLNPPSINLIAKLDNPMLSKEDLATINRQEDIKQKQQERWIRQDKELDIRIKERQNRLETYRQEEQKMKQSYEQLLASRKFEEAERLMREFYQNANKMLSDDQSEKKQ
jgi:hypothetical protein